MFSTFASRNTPDPTYEAEKKFAKYNETSAEKILCIFSSWIGICAYCSNTQWWLGEQMIFLPLNFSLSEKIQSAHFGVGVCVRKKSCTLTMLLMYVDGVNVCETLCDVEGVRKGRKWKAEKNTIQQQV